jgi:UvrD-like helicase C-terminal domain
VQELQRVVAYVTSPASWSRTAVLVRRGQAAGLLGSLLMQQGIPAEVAGGNGFFRRPEVVDVISALTLVLHPWDEVSVLTVVRSPFVHASDDALLALLEALPVSGRIGWPDVMVAAEDELVEASVRSRLLSLEGVFARLRQLLLTAPLSSLVQHLLVATGYRVAVGTTSTDHHHGNAQLDKLIELGHGAIGEAVLMLQRWRDAIDDPPTEAEAMPGRGDAVRVMTIHQAKGLEFDRVIITDLGAPLPADSDDIEMHPSVGLAVTARGRVSAALSPRRGSPAQTRMQAIRAARREDAKQEQLRLLYVAMTRAKRELVIIGQPRHPSSLLALVKDASQATLLATQRSGEPLAPGGESALPTMETMMATMATMPTTIGPVFMQADVIKDVRDSLHDQVASLLHRGDDGTAGTLLQGLRLVLGLGADVDERLWRALGSPLLAVAGRRWCEAMWTQAAQLAKRWPQPWDVDAAVCCRHAGVTWTATVAARGGGDVLSIIAVCEPHDDNHDRALACVAVAALDHHNDDIRYAILDARTAPRWQTWQAKDAARWRQRFEANAARSSLQ